MYYIDESRLFSYDGLEIYGAKTCSLTIRGDGSEVSAGLGADSAVAIAGLEYEPFVETGGAAAIAFGVHVRAVWSTAAELCLKLYDRGFGLISTASVDVAADIGYNFKKLCRPFKIPPSAVYFKPLIKISGKTTALSLFFPFAYGLSKGFF
jgi:hypothetical protein